MIDRTLHKKLVRTRLRQAPVVAILGARQVGKTTLARAVAEADARNVTWFDLENVADRARLAEPLRALQPLRGLVVLDEIQHEPRLFETLRVLADRPRRPARFLVLGSASLGLLRQSSESLAGRIAHHELRGLSLDEVGHERLERLWLRGGFPRSFLATSAADSEQWREDFIRTFLERDLPQLGVTVPAPTLRRFWTMLAHYHGQIWNASEFARSLGSDHKTARRYLDLLTQTFVVRQLQPWFANLGKRQVKSPKVYLSDSGLLHALLRVRTSHDLEGHPKVGASWEGFLLEEVVHCLRARADETYFWSAHAGPELDLLIASGRTRLGFEFKRTVAPTVTPSMRQTLELLDLNQLAVVHAGEHTFDLGPRIRAIAARRLLDDLKPLR